MKATTDTNTDTLLPTVRIMHGAEELLRGDDASVKVIFHNLTGRNFVGKTVEEHDQYLRYMESGEQFGRRLNVELLRLDTVPDPAAVRTEAHRLAAVLHGCSALRHAMFAPTEFIGLAESMLIPALEGRSLQWADDTRKPEEIAAAVRAAGEQEWTVVGFYDDHERIHETTTVWATTGEEAADRVLQESNVPSLRIVACFRGRHQNASADIFNRSLADVEEERARAAAKTDTPDTPPAAASRSAIVTEPPWKCHDGWASSVTFIRDGKTDHDADQLCLKKFPLWYRSSRTKEGAIQRQQERIAVAQEVAPGLPVVPLYADENRTVRSAEHLALFPEPVTSASEEPEEEAAVSAAM